MVKRNDTEEAIRAASLQLFGSKGFEATGIRDIARDVGLTPGAIYHYIGSKEDLLVRIMRDGSTMLLRGGKAALAEVSEAPADRLAALVGFHVRTHCEVQLEAQVADYELRSLTDANRRTIVKLRDRYEALWREVIAAGVEQGAFSVADQRLCRLALIQMCTGVVNWYSEDGPLSRDEVVAGFVSLALQMVGAAPPDGAPPDGAAGNGLPARAKKAAPAR